MTQRSTVVLRMPFSPARVLALLLVVSAGCGGDPSLEDELIGAWYGDDGPDGDQCFVFCGDGRIFSGDRPCDDSEAGDFETSSRVTFGEDSFSVVYDGEAVSVTGVSVTGDTLTYGFDGVSFQATRTASPGYCSSRP